MVATRRRESFVWPDRVPMCRLLTRSCKLSKLRQAQDGVWVAGGWADQPLPWRLCGKFGYIPTQNRHLGRWVSVCEMQQCMSWQRENARACQNSDIIAVVTHAWALLCIAVISLSVLVSRYTIPWQDLSCASFVLIANSLEVGKRKHLTCRVTRY